MTATIIWFRRDLRLFDHEALTAACQSADIKTLIPLYIYDDHAPSVDGVGEAQQWWLHHSLKALSKSLEERGLELILRKGKPLDILKQLVKDHDVKHLYWHRCYEPYTIERDKEIKAYFINQGLTVKSFKGYYLFEPGRILNKKKQPFKVFGQFWKTCLKDNETLKPLGIPVHWPAKMSNVSTETLEDWALLPQHPNWAQGFRIYWQPGEQGAQERWALFCKGKGLNRYKATRNTPSEDGTSRLSPFLHFGEISIRQIWYTLMTATEPNSSVNKFLAELGWREFSGQLLYHFPTFAEKNFRPQFDHLFWQPTEAILTQWQKGQTGYPIVDAGMRQLWQRGWMHNRVRMVVASFLCKHLLIDWREGTRWFSKTLLDANLANNAMGWQWVAGSGVDASPYFRIFNPVLQAQKFDEKGVYVRKWVPELKDLPNKYIHQPWTAPSDVLAAAGITLGQTYPRPIVVHEEARRRALDRYKEMREKAAAFKELVLVDV